MVDLVNQGVVKLSDPLEQYLPSNVTVPSYDGYKITLEDLATHTSGLPYWPPGWIWNKYYTTQQVYEFLLIPHWKMNQRPKPITLISEWNGWTCDIIEDGGSID